MIDLIVRNRHLIHADSPTKKAIRAIVDIHAGTLAKERFIKNKVFDITGEQHCYLTTVSIGAHTTVEEIAYLAGHRAMLLLENSYYEWPAYKRMIDAYSSDPVYGNMFKMLRTAKDRNLITGEHLGGCGQLKSALKSLERNIGGRNLAMAKTCTLLDRDSDSPADFSERQHSNIEHLSRKPVANITHADIYDLNQPNHRWHMWYWRMVENYFPDRVYKDLGYDISRIPPTPERHWSKISDCFKGTSKAFNKPDVGKLGATMARTDYESGLQHFTIEGKDMSELQLFLLKLVKTI